MRKPEDGSGGDGLCMIDPVVLSGVVNDLAAMEAAIAAETKSLKGEFAKVGAPSAALNELAKVGAWLHGELPMLRRRQAAAALLASQRMQCVPGTNLISMSEDPAFASQQAGDLAAKQILAGLGGKPPTRDASVAAAAAVRKVTGRGGKLSADDLAFLEALYGGLGRTVYQVPGQLGEDKAAKAALADGLLMLSNEKLGGGFSKLPGEIRQDLRDTGWRHWNAPGDKTADPWRGSGFPELARFLLNRDPKSKIGPGDEFATSLGRSTVENLHLQQFLEDEYDHVPLGGTPQEMAQTPLLNTSEVQQLLGVVAFSHQVSATLMSDREAVRVLIGHGWEDKGAAVAGLFEWAAKVALDPKSPEYVMAKQATADLINAVTVNDSDKTSPGHQMFKQSVGWVKDNPEIAQAFSKLVAANLSDFGDPEPAGASGPEDKFHLRISTDQRHRFAMLASTDQEARIILRVGAEAFKLDALRNPASDEAKSAGFIDAMIAAAAHNAVYFEHMNEADDKNKAAAAVRADDAMVKSIALYVFGALYGPLRIPEMPVKPGEAPDPNEWIRKSGNHGVDAGKWILGRILDEVIMEVPEPDPTLPTGVDTDADATGVGVAEGRAFYDLANARVRVGDVKGLNPDLLERGKDGRPRLRELATLTSSDWRLLQGWAPQAGSDYAEIYANAFRSYYSLGEKIEDGPDGLKNFVESSTKVKAPTR